MNIFDGFDAFDWIVVLMVYGYINHTPTTTYSSDQRVITANPTQLVLG